MHLLSPFLIEAACCAGMGTPIALPNERALDSLRPPRCPVASNPKRTTPTRSEGSCVRARAPNEGVPCRNGDCYASAFASHGGCTAKNRIFALRR
jgi:hypothetical protein